MFNHNGRLFDLQLFAEGEETNDGNNTDLNDGNDGNDTSDDGSNKGENNPDNKDNKDGNPHKKKNEQLDVKKGSVQDYLNRIKNGEALSDEDMQDFQLKYADHVKGKKAKKDADLIIKLEEELNKLKGSNKTREQELEEKVTQLNKEKLKFKMTTLLADAKMPIAMVEWFTNPPSSEDDLIERFPLLRASWLSELKKAVGQNSSPPGGGGSGGNVLSLESIGKMSTEEYEKNKDKIMEALSKGRLR